KLQRFTRSFKFHVTERAITPFEVGGTNGGGKYFLGFPASGFSSVGEVHLAGGPVVFHPTSNVVESHTLQFALGFIDGSAPTEVGREIAEILPTKHIGVDASENESLGRY